jgi:phosphoglycerol transferase MdoB-like AlkP superfamily enzyme
MTDRFRPLLALGAASLLVGAVLRAVLWWQFGVADGVTASELPSVLARGLLNDLVVTLYAFTPFALYLALITERWMRSRANRILVSAGSWITLFAMVFLAVAERYFFEEFDARFNLVAFDYLMYPTEVVGDVWTEYPVVRTAIAAALIASAGLFAMRRWGRSGGGIGA